MNKHSLLQDQNEGYIDTNECIRRSDLIEMYTEGFISLITLNKLF